MRLHYGGIRGTAIQYEKPCETISQIIWNEMC